LGKGVTFTPIGPEVAPRRPQIVTNDIGLTKEFFLINVKLIFKKTLIM